MMRRNNPEPGADSLPEDLKEKLWEYYGIDLDDKHKLRWWQRYRRVLPWWESDDPDDMDPTDFPGFVGLVVTLALLAGTVMFPHWFGLVVKRPH